MSGEPGAGTGGAGAVRGAGAAGAPAPFPASEMRAASDDLTTDAPTLRPSPTLRAPVHPDTPHPATPHAAAPHPTALPTDAPRPEPHVATEELLVPWTAPSRTEAAATAPRAVAPWALAASVLALLVSLFVGWGFLIGAVAVVAGIVALRRPTEVRGMAVWAIVLGAVSLVYSAGWIAWAATQGNLFA